MSIVEKFGIGTLIFGIILTLLWNVLAGGLSGLPAFISLGGLVYWLIGLFLFRLLKLSIGNVWQGIACALPVVILVGWLIHFYTYDGATNKFLIREGFRGQVIIVYDWPGGIKPATKEDSTIFVIPPDGLLKVSIPYKSTNIASSSWYYMGLKDTTRKKIRWFTSDLPIDTVHSQILNFSSGGFTSDGIGYKTESFVIDLPDSSTNKQIGEYKDEKYRRLYRLAHGEEAYRQLFGKEK